MKKLMKLLFFVAAGAGILQVLQKKQMLPPPDEGIWKPFSGEAETSE